MAMPQGPATSGGYTPFTDFPSPELLYQAQRKYRLLRHRATPTEPGPPPSSKWTFANRHQWQEVDQHASQTPLSLAAKSYSDLLSHLIVPAKSEAAMVRAMFVWIASQNITDINAYYNKHGLPAPGTPFFDISRIFSHGETVLYNTILERMCSEANIPCRVVEGVIKDSRYKVGDGVCNRTQYVLVFVEGSWRFIDQYWGSHFVTPAVEDGFIKVAESAAAEPEEGGATNADDFWFFTDPEEMIYSHCSCDPQNQLLARPLSCDEFTELANLGQCFFELGLTDISQRKCILYTKEGKIALEFSYQPDRKLKFGHSLYKSVDPNAEANLVDGNSLKQYVFMENNNGCLRIQISFPRIGKYKLKIDGGDLEWGPHTRWLCSYVIHCNEPDFSTKANPPNNIDEWGPGAMVRDLQMKPHNEGGIVAALKGETDIRFTMKVSSTLQFYPELESGNIPSDELKDFVCQYKSDGEVVFVLKVPEHGKYIFKIRARKDQYQQYKSLCNYLITSDRGCTDLTPYPLVKDTSLQDSESDKPVLVPVSHKQRILKCPSTGEMTITMESKTQELELKSTLERQNTKGHMQNASDYLYHSQAGEYHHFKIIFHRTGMHTLSIYKQSPHEGETIQLYWYIIDVKTPSSNGLPFPKPTPEWKQSYTLLMPQRKFLVRGEDTVFKLNIPHTKHVYLMDKDNNLSHLIEDTEDQMSGSWRGSFGVDVVGRLMLMMVKTGTEMSLTLLEFKVVEYEDYMNRLELTKKNAKKQAEKIQSNEQKRDDDQQQIAQKAIKEEADREHSARACFERERAAYEAEERRFQEQEEEREMAAVLSTDETDVFEEMQFVALRHDIDAKMKEIEQENNEAMTTARALVDAKLDRLRSASRGRNRRELQQAIDAVVAEEQISGNDRDLRLAKTLLSNLDAEHKLRVAVVLRDPVAINEEIRTIRESGLGEDLKDEVEKAKGVVDALAKRKRMQTIRAGMSRKILNEIIHDPTPPEGLHHIIQATLLLLGVDEGRTKDWNDCRIVCNPVSPEPLGGRLERFNCDEIKPNVIGRVKEILDPYHVKYMETESSTKAKCLKWCKDVIDYTECYAKDNTIHK